MDESQRVFAVFFCFSRVFSAFLLFAVTFPALLWTNNAAAATVYAVTGGRGGPGPSTLYAVDSATGNATLIGATGVDQIVGLAIDPTSGILYGHQNYPDSFDAIGTLHRIDLSTGVATPVGQTNAAITDISFHSSGQLYGWMDGSSRDGFTEFSDKLVTIDKDSAVFSLVDTTRVLDVGVNQSGLAFTPNDRLFLKSGDVDRRGEPPEEWEGTLYQMDEALAVSVSSSPTDAAPVSTLAAISNRLALTVVRGFDDSGDLASALATLDLTTGVVEFGPAITENGNSMNITAIAVPVSVPEPNAVLLLMIGAARLLARRRR
ncbi:hypothetical protein LF1_50630 [Rubripirellula obstinata]|uniref:PEP-CTERM protein-sorting domain-containing protein n=1 Tax=Rubripirellula obstinata TaxID=406547 RepID=A0A5B1CNA0_9BACT|nr:PEP-CTERM sorting domain-containing protein [Rubripirellula obstinata]KAA1262498.1 hypothetical protein LF1_50630 [Rubripirellula obstinata]